MSDMALLSGTTNKIGVTNSIDRDGSHDVATTFEHFSLDQCTFQANEFTITIIIGVNVNLSIVNQLGQVMCSENCTLASGSNNVQLNTSALASGVYFVTVS